MADIDKYLQGQNAPNWVTHQELIETLTSVYDTMRHEFEASLMLTPKPSEVLERERYMLDVARTLLTHSAEDSPEEFAALAYLRGIIVAALPPEESNTRLDQRASGEPEGRAQSAPGAGEGVLTEDSGVAVSHEAEDDGGSGPQDRAAKRS